MSTAIRLRADAARNREAIVTAAEEMFGEHGLDVAIDEIARRAGVGNATLYRRFPARADLIAAVFTDRLRAHVDAIESALDDPDPWNGFTSYVVTACEMQVHDRGLADLITSRMPAVPVIERLQAKAYDGFVQLARRAQHAGHLRDDFAPEDLVIILMANAGLIARAHRAEADASRRLVHIVVDGLRADAATPGAQAPTRRRMLRSMTRRPPVGVSAGRVPGDRRSS